MRDLSLHSLKINRRRKGEDVFNEEPSSVEKIMEIDEHIGCAMSGLIADARTLVEHARVETQSRPFGVSLLIAGHDENGPSLSTCLRHVSSSENEEVCILYGSIRHFLIGNARNGKAIGSGSEGLDTKLKKLKQLLFPS
uniref:proteasome subunit alpha type-5-like n=1 Tax=Erigeron canadensis TaxID=72917 RepID=UPI001CB9BE6F|nr:proteasome subunit alpha type-5-like [Erigeron canadensis]